MWQWLKKLWKEEQGGTKRVSDSSGKLIYLSDRYSHLREDQMILERTDHIVKACVTYNGEKLVRQYDSRSGEVRWMKVVKDWNFYLYTIDGEEEVEKLEKAYDKMCDLHLSTYEM